MDHNHILKHNMVYLRLSFDIKIWAEKAMLQVHILQSLWDGLLIPMQGGILRWRQRVMGAHCSPVKDLPRSWRIFFRHIKQITSMSIQDALVLKVSKWIMKKWVCSWDQSKDWFSHLIENKTIGIYGGISILTDPLWRCAANVYLIFYFAKQSTRVYIRYHWYQTRVKHCVV